MREGWTYKKLGEICKVITKGTTPTTIGYKFTDNGINFIKIECIDSNRNLIKENLTFISEECNNSMIRSQLQEKDLLFSIAGALGRIYIVEKSVLPANTNQALAIIRLSDKQDLFLLYLSYFLNSDTIKRQIEKDKVGVAQLNLSLGQIKDFIIPIPSIAEQQRIVSELDLLSSIIEKKKAQLKEYDQLAQSIFFDMFGDPVENEKGWEVKKLGECLSYIKNGANIKQTKGASGIPITRIETLSGGVFNRDRLGYADIFSTEKYSQYIMDDGDILMSHINSKAYIGRAVLYQKQGNEQIIHGMNLLRLKVISSVLSSTYINYFFKSDYFRDRVAKIRKDAVNQSSMAISDLVKINILLPPLSLQQSFAEKIEAIERQKERIRQSMEEVKTLFDSRMDYYFN